MTKSRHITQRIVNHVIQGQPILGKMKIRARRAHFSVFSWGLSFNAFNSVPQNHGRLTSSIRKRTKKKKNHFELLLYLKYLRNSIITPISYSQSNCKMVFFFHPNKLFYIWMITFKYLSISRIEVEKVSKRAYSRDLKYQNMMVRTEVEKQKWNTCPNWSVFQVLHLSIEGFDFFFFRYDKSIIIILYVTSKEGPEKRLKENRRSLNHLSESLEVAYHIIVVANGGRQGWKPTYHTPHLSVSPLTTFFLLL